MWLALNILEVIDFAEKTRKGLEVQWTLLWNTGLLRLSFVGRDKIKQTNMYLCYS